MRIDESPTSGKVRVPFRQGPDAMQMIRQDDRRINLERMFMFHIDKRCPQRIDKIGQ